MRQSVPLTVFVIVKLVEPEGGLVVVGGSVIVGGSVGSKSVGVATCSDTETAQNNVIKNNITATIFFHILFSSNIKIRGARWLPLVRQISAFGLRVLRH